MSLEQEPASPPSRGQDASGGRDASGASSDDEVREFLLANTDAPAASRPRRDALHLSAAVVAVIAVLVVVVVAVVAALPYLIQGAMWLMFALDPCQDWLNGCG